MTKFLFDSCCFGRVALNRFIEFLGTSGDGAEFAHLADFQLEEQLDDDWVPLFVEGRWIVITSDRGSNPSRGSKLPLLCRHYGLTHVLLSASVHDMKTFDKARAIAAVWPDLLKLCDWPRGSEHRLQKTASGGFVLRSPELKDDERKGPKTQADLF